MREPLSPPPRPPRYRRRPVPVPVPARSGASPAGRGGSPPAPPSPSRSAGATLNSLPRRRARPLRRRRSDWLRPTAAPARHDGKCSSVPPSTTAGLRGGAGQHGSCSPRRGLGGKLRGALRGLGGGGSEWAPLSCGARKVPLKTLKKTWVFGQCEVLRGCGGAAVAQTPQMSAPHLSYWRGPSLPSQNWLGGAVRQGPRTG